MPSEVPRFAPGEIVAERYRIVSLLGRGGMGEVYRADDLTLEQPVALKFLPEALARDEDYLARFLDEVRVARQISHPNACRVHDVGRITGGDGRPLPFLSMEYVDGEDLASLLRRIGRLPEDKAVEIARQICAGLAAAHGQGILHRDLKPANVMLDGEGRVRIADFGLAAAASSLTDADALAGTPAYMAPELLEGRSPSVQSDLFALGLVLFELYCGRPAYRAGSLDELRRQHREVEPAPSTHLRNLDPAVDAAIRRCLARDPQRRPRSAHEVAVALPGGDPLAAALAAGETPSVELVAAAGGRGGLRPGLAVGLLALVLALAAGIAALSRRHQLLEVVQPQLSLDVLAHRAQELARSFGFAAPADTSRALVQQVPRALLALERADVAALLAQPAAEAVRFWYRGSPYTLVPETVVGRVNWGRPPVDRPGMFNVILGHDGRLLGFTAMPSRLPPTAEFDWAQALDAAGLGGAALREEPPAFLPTQPCTERRAWRGAHPDLAHAEVQVQAAAFGDQLTHLAIVVDHHAPPVPDRAQAPQIVVFEWAFRLLLAVTVVGGLWLGARNLAAGRGDRPSATRIGVFVFAIAMLAWLLGADHVPSDPGAETTLVLRASAWWLWQGVLAGVVYLALEPTVRRHWPGMLRSSSRVVLGRVGDGLVTRDALIGMAGGVGLILLSHLNLAAVAALDGRIPTLFLTEGDPLLGPRHLLAHYADLTAQAAFTALTATFVLVVAKLLCRRTDLALALMFVLALARMPYAFVSDHFAVDLAFRSAQACLLLAVLFRYGTWAIFVALVALDLVDDVVMWPRLGAWYSGPTLFAWAVLLGAGGMLAWWSARPPRLRVVA